MRVTFLGEHGFRDLPQTLGFVVQTDETTLLVECGQYVDLSLASLGVDAESVDGVYVSHNHVDHAGGVEAFIVTQAMRRFLGGGTHADHSVSVISDAAVEIAGFKDLKRSYPLLSGPGMSGVKMTEVGLSAEFVEWRDLRLTTFPLAHAVPSACLVIQNADRTIVWWADGIDPSEGNALKGVNSADLLVASVLGSDKYSKLAEQFKFLTANAAATTCKRLSGELALVHHFYAADEQNIISDVTDVGIANARFGKLGETIEV